MEELLLLVVYYALMAVGAVESPTNLVLMAVGAVVSPTNLVLISAKVSRGPSCSRSPTPALSLPSWASGASSLPTSAPCSSTP